MNTKRLNGKKALITGASSGIGKATAICLAQEGCNLLLISRREEQLKVLKNEVSAYDIETHYLAGDVTDKGFVDDIYLHVREYFKKLDILVLAAGSGFIKPFGLTSDADFRSLMEVNTFGVVNVCNAGVKFMNRGGAIILLTSPAGLYGAKGMTAYSLSKGGLVGFGKSLALELATQRIRVNIISPGFVPTEMTKKLYGILSDEQRKKIEEGHPLGVGSVQDIANTVAFLASDEASWITGVVLPVDGGFTIGK